jgi:DUF1009 family protein
MLEKDPKKEQLHKVVVDLVTKSDIKISGSERFLNEIKINTNKYLKENKYGYDVTYINFATNCIKVHFSNEEYVLVQLH